MKKLLVFVFAITFLPFMAQARNIATYKAESSGETTTAQRVYGIQYVSTASAGTVALQVKDSSGDTKLNVATPASIGSHYIELPPDGIYFGGDVYIHFTNVDYVTLFVPE